MNETTGKEWLAEEMERLRSRIMDLEKGLQEAVLPAFHKIRGFVSREPAVTQELREELIRGLAELKYERRGTTDELANWFEAEEEVDFILKRLGPAQD